MNDLECRMQSILETDASIIPFYKGRVALYAILKALGVGPGDEIILPAYTCVVVPNAILYLGARPVYVDIDLSTYSAKLENIVQAITKNTKVVLAQNTYGLSANVDEIVSICHEKGIFTIEDCTHGFGGTYKEKKNGSWCDAAFFSSQWNKPFSTGIGGYAMLIEPNLASKVRDMAIDFDQPSIRSQAMLWMLMKVRHLLSPSTYYMFVEAYRYLSKHNIVVGSSSGEELDSLKMPDNYLLGMSTIQKRAAISAIKKLPEVNAMRKANGILYTSRLMELGLNHVSPKFQKDHLFLKYPILVHDRAKFSSNARRARIPLGDWFCSPLHPVQGDLKKWNFNAELYPEAVFAAEHVVNLPTDAKNACKVIDFIIENSGLIMKSDDKSLR